jgi:dipeptidyl aminopeptidase/acylaminoacyl peptidase
MLTRSLLTAISLLTLLAATPAPGEDLAPDPLAHAFGTMAAMQGPRLSPDGSKLSFLMMHTTDIPILIVRNLETGAAQVALASEKDRAELAWCDWANDERLLCGFDGIAREFGEVVPVTRLVAVDEDGSDRRVLLQKKLREEYTQFQDRIVDWLPDDPEHVLVQVPGKNGSGVSQIDIYTGKTKKVDRNKQNIRSWMSDGRGKPRLRMRFTDREIGSQYRVSGEREWHDLYKSKLENFDDYSPIGFGANPNSLFVIKPLEGRLALFEIDLANELAERLVFSHPSVDVGGAEFLGKFRRMVAVGYSTDMPHLHFFDPAVEQITERIAKAIPGKAIGVVGESWDRRYYLILASSDRDSGTFYRFDTEKNHLLRIGARNPKLDGYALAPMQPIQYTADDGTSIPGYLTLPLAAAKGPVPAVILPHGGPESRDYWGFDWIVQYLAAKGYAVLQTNYRGSGGFGDAWSGDGGFQRWRIAMSDIADGADHLVEANIANPTRLCIVGWSYGGYAALMSGIVEPDRYRCIVSIAGVTDPGILIKKSRRFLGSRAVKAFISTDDEVLEAGSPLERSREIKAPVLLFHGDEDINVTVDHSRKLAKALKRKKQPVRYIEYEEVEHGIRRNAYRIDMLTRIGAFLDEHTRATKSPGSTAD